MSGQAGGRGYLIQALISVLDAIADDTEWQTLELEPNAASDKVDVIWNYPTRKRAVQIKSSQNQITVSQAKGWAVDLKTSISADEYELRLIGPISAGLTDLTGFDSVAIPTPQPLNVEGLIHQASHKLDRYLASRGLPSPSPAAREIIVQALVTQFSSLSTQGTPLGRPTLEALLKTWVSQLHTATVGQIPRSLSQLPPPPADFTGRDREIETLISRLASSIATIAAIRGMGGVGKSSLAIALGRHLIDQFPDGQLYLDVRGTKDSPRSASDVMLHAIRSFVPDARATDEGSIAALYRSLLDGKRVLFLLDDVLSEKQVESLIPSTGSLLLITSRQQFTLPGQISFDLDVFREDEAKSLLITIAPRIEGHAAEVAELCGFLPLALRLSASAISERRDLSVVEYLDRLRERRTRFDLIDASLSLSTMLVPEHVRAVFFALSIFPWDFDREAACAVLGVNERDGVDLLGHLLRFSLIQFDDDSSRYRMHDLARVFAEAHLDSQTLSGLATGFSLHFLSVCRRAEELYEEGNEHVNEALNLFDIERKNIEVGFLFSARNAPRDDDAADACVDYALSCPRVRDLRQTTEDQLQWCQCAVEAAGRIKDTKALASLMGNLGRCLSRMGRLEAALSCHRAIQVTAHRAGDRELETLTHLHIGNVLRQSGRIREAKESYESCLAMCENPENRTLEGHALNNIAAIELDLGNVQRAKEYWEKALEIFIGTGDQRSAAITMANLGSIIRKSSDPQFGVELLNNAVSIANDLRDVASEMTFLGMLADSLAELGESADALDASHRRLEIARASNNVSAYVDALLDAAVLVGRLDDDGARAAVYLSEARELASRLDLNMARLRILAIDAQAAIAAGDGGHAVELLSTRLELARSLAGPIEVARFSWQLGELLVEQGNEERGFSHMQAAVDGFREAGYARADEIQDALNQMRCRSQPSE